ncbi:MAG: hypothetical protein M3Z21_05440, partial [Pseudomonadota bacterium]|nr:hypothetical protein [Pseudomonadota bacterium]
PYSFPIKRCLCIIGSDYKSYNLVRVATGNYSDGLVKQDHAYLVAGVKPQNSEKPYGYHADQRCYWANVHRAHSGRHGIVNSYESYENIRRFLFGNIKAEIYLDNLKILTKKEGNIDYSYDFEFLFSIRESNAYLHRVEQQECENALRLKRGEVPGRLFLHTGFMNSQLKEPDADFSRFYFEFRIIERRVEDGLIWDTEYPHRPIYQESVEIRVGDIDKDNPGNEADYRWLSEGDKWRRLDPEDPDAKEKVFRFPLRKAASVKGDVLIVVSHWPDTALTQD